LIVATVSTIKPRDIRAVWTAGWHSVVAGSATFAGVLLFPVQIAVVVGVGLSLALYLNSAAADISVVELAERDDGRIEEREPSETLDSDRVTVLDVYGDLFFAGARTLDRRLPRVDDARNPAVVIRLRGRTKIGATLVDVLSGYAGKIDKAGGRLYLSGLSDEVRDELTRSGKVDLDGPVSAYEATAIVGESTRRAVGDARAWLVERRDADGDGDA
jgi:SulP family sulfate permease